MRNFGGGEAAIIRIFAYSSTREQSNKRSGTRLKTESENGERRSPHTPALLARETYARFTDFFTDFEKKRLFCSLTLFVNSKKLKCESNSLQREVGKAGFPIP